MNTTATSPNETDSNFLSQCVALAREAFEAGDNPFGSILVDEHQHILATARNRSHSKTIIAHPEFELAKWALEHLDEMQRRKATMYTSGEHCPMCAGAHAYAQIGRLVFLSSAEQLLNWRKEHHAPEALLHFIPTRDIIRNVQIDGPFEGPLLEEIKALQYAAIEREKAS